jgi:hypothetical protein
MDEVINIKMSDKFIFINSDKHPWAHCLEGDHGWYNEHGNLNSSLSHKQAQVLLIRAHCFKAKQLIFSCFLKVNQKISVKSFIMGWATWICPPLWKGTKCFFLFTAPKSAPGPIWLSTPGVRTPLWSNGQSAWLQIRRPRFDSRNYQKRKSSGSGTGSTQPREYNWGATW